MVVENGDESLQSLFESVVADYFTRCDAGLPVDQKQLISSHPAIASKLRDFFENESIITEKVGRPASTRSMFEEWRAVEELESSGMSIDGYRLDQIIGAGASGLVVKAFHSAMQRRVAIKVLALDLLPPSDERRKRFSREIRASWQIDHPNVVHGFDAGTWRGFPYLVMEWIDGHNFHQLASRQSLDYADCAELIRQAAIGLEHAHRQGWIHRDIKPENLLLDAEGQVKIVDFGLARFKLPSHESRATADGVLLGTLQYMAPEQLADSGKVDEAADVFSLGATLFFLLTGRPPRPNNMALIFASVGTQQPAITDEGIRSERADIPPEMVKLLHDMLEFEASDRPALPQIIDRLTRLAGGAKVAELAANSTRQPDSGPVQRLEDSDNARRILRALHEYHGSTLELTAEPVRQKVRSQRWIPVAIGCVAALLVIGLIVWSWVDPGGDAGSAANNNQSNVDNNRADHRGANAENSTRSPNTSDDSVEHDSRDAGAADREAGDQPFWLSPVVTTRPETRLGGLLLDTGFDNEGRRWNLETVAPRGNVVAAAWHPGELGVAVATDRNVIRIYTYESKQLVAIAYASSPVCKLAWSFDGLQVMIVCADSVRSFDVVSRQVVMQFDAESIRDAVWIPGSKECLVLGDSIYHVDELGEAEELRLEVTDLGQFDLIDGAWSRELGNDDGEPGLQVALAGRQGCYLFGHDGNRIGDFSGDMKAIRFSPDGDALAATVSPDSAPACDLVVFNIASENSRLHGSFSHNPIATLPHPIWLTKNRIGIVTNDFHANDFHANEQQAREVAAGQPTVVVTPIPFVSASFLERIVPSPLGNLQLRAKRDAIEILRSDGEETDWVQPRFYDVAIEPRWSRDGNLFVDATCLFGTDQPHLNVRNAAIMAFSDDGLIENAMTMKYGEEFSSQLRWIHAVPECAGISYANMLELWNPSLGYMVGVIATNLSELDWASLHTHPSFCVIPRNRPHVCQWLRQPTGKNEFEVHQEYSHDGALKRLFLSPSDSFLATIWERDGENHVSIWTLDQATKIDDLGPYSGDARVTWSEDESLLVIADETSITNYQVDADGTSQLQSVTRSSDATNVMWVESAKSFVYADESRLILHGDERDESSEIDLGGTIKSFSTNERGECAVLVEDRSSLSHHLVILEISVVSMKVARRFALPPHQWISVNWRPGTSDLTLKCLDRIVHQMDSETGDSIWTLIVPPAGVQTLRFDSLGRLNFERVTQETKQEYVQSINAYFFYVIEQPDRSLSLVDFETFHRGE